MRTRAMVTGKSGDGEDEGILSPSDALTDKAVVPRHFQPLLPWLNSIG